MPALTGRGSHGGVSSGLTGVLNSSISAVEYHGGPDMSTDSPSEPLDEVVIWLVVEGLVKRRLKTLSTP
jgi:hypothetical protein